MENVVCSLDVELTDGGDIFGDGWNFTVGIYNFQKISATKVRITFNYEDEVTRVDEDGVTSIGHDSYSERYINVEESLQTLLDLICFQTSGIGIRISPDSREMRSSHLISHRVEQQHEMSLKDHDDLEVRFDTTIQNNDEKLLDALRLNRLAANEENEGEKIGQLWGAVERLYASDPPKVLDTDEKREELSKLIDQAQLIDDDDKARLKNTINNTYKVSKPSVIAEKFGLISGEGEKMSVADVKRKLDYWISTRSYQSHGIILMRNQDVRLLAGEMDLILETVLSSEVKPSKYVYVVYKSDNVNEEFLSSRSASTKLDKNSGYSYTPLHKFAAFDDLNERFKNSLRLDSSELYIVDYKSVNRVSRRGDSEDVSQNLPSHLRRLLEKLHNKLN